MKLYTQINDEVIELTGQALEDTVTLQQELQAISLAADEAAAQAVIDKAALLAKLGITADEAKLLVG